MKILTYKINNFDTPQIGVLQNQLVYNLNNCLGNISLIELIQLEKYQDQVASFICNEDCQKHDIENIIFLPPLKPNSFRDAYAFKQHVEAGRKARGLPMIKEFDLNPVYYYSNHSAITGPGTLSLNKKHLNNLDFELELAIIIGKEGENIYVNISNSTDKEILVKIIDDGQGFKEKDTSKIFKRFYSNRPCLLYTSDAADE